MSKVYDRVEWDFVDAILFKKGFPVRFRQIIRNCISSVNFSFKINGQIVGKVTLSRGLRHGCSLSPYLFILCAERLSATLKKAETNGNLEGLKCSRNCPPISHLLFVDDSIVFSKATSVEAASIVNILNLYECASGQQVNLEKTTISFSPNTPQALRQTIWSIFGIHSPTSIGTYFGLPSMFERDKKQSFALIREKIWKRLHTWNRNLFSSAGRKILIKVVVQAIPTYFMSLFSRGRKGPKGIDSEATSGPNLLSPRRPDRRPPAWRRHHNYDQETRNGPNETENAGQDCSTKFDSREGYSARAPLTLSCSRS
ncbi:Uncharacterized mitochondrial protein AtMg01250 [Striga hermonthica]|uniref:Uncharacterized mitochondrial protein AtMg01250 n=1 Tax=Striga hermonthica TaxID=68872 RepID=A0A9N7RT33_STRHE|nr:Uncharacterized mitochondrial protein AtMg01250 [Striga hermonthica]